MTMHRFIDRSLTPLFKPLKLVFGTESYTTVHRSEISQLSGENNDPQTAVVSFGRGLSGQGLVVSEPSLCTTVLSRMWRSTRNSSTPLTQVESEIIRQFLARVCGEWRTAWTQEDAFCIPNLSMVAPLSMAISQADSEIFHVARIVIRDADNPLNIVGVLLFAYPDSIINNLRDDCLRVSWRNRIRRGLKNNERDILQHKLKSSLKDLVVTTPVKIQQTVSLGAISTLERGDIIPFDLDQNGLLPFYTLERKVQGHLAKHGNRLAIAIDSPAVNAPTEIQPNPTTTTPTEQTGELL